MHIEPVAVAPAVSVADADVRANAAVTLHLGAALATGDANDHISAVISGVTAGASLSAGHNNGDGSWTLSQTDPAHVAVTPPVNFTGDLHMTLTAYAQNDNGMVAAKHEDFLVHVHAADWTASVAPVVDAAASSSDHALVFQGSAHA